MQILYKCITFLANVLIIDCGTKIVNKSIFPPPTFNTENELSPEAYEISDSYGYGRTLDGIGGLSGGGATSRLLMNYPGEYLNQILDYLFLPNFGASLQILKVEIGGDAQSTDGTEPSHMHTEDETPNFRRGYEWWLMKEAKKRNPNIILVALPWSWPGWIGGKYASPYSDQAKSANYVTSWIKGAFTSHNLKIDYVGIWNERPYDIEYIKVLRNTLDENGLKHVVIIAADETYFSTISEALLEDQKLDLAVGVIGTHYPGTISSPSAIKTQKTLWASEDYSTFNDNVGAGCWGRILNQNYVNGNMTATIAWNLVASYYNNLPFNRTSLMTANEPWSGHYVVSNTVWVTAHTTQFTQPGWKYLKTTGHLKKGGSMVALSDGLGNLTVIIETMSHNNSVCVRPPLPYFSVQSQSIGLILDGSFKNISKLYTWSSNFGKSSSTDQVFNSKVLNIHNGKVTILVDPDMIMTLTTVNTGKKGSFQSIPPSKSFPLPYSDNFDQTGNFSEAFYFADQSGVFEIFHNESSKDGHEWTMRQVVLERPITWCDDSDSPITVIGDHSWTSMNLTVDVKMEGAPAIFLAVRVDVGGCNVRGAKGVFLWLHSDNSWELTTSLQRTAITKICYSDWTCWHGKNIRINHDGWNRLSLLIHNSTAVGYLNSAVLFKQNLSPNDIPSTGWAAFGVGSFTYAQFDNFSVEKVKFI